MNNQKTPSSDDENDANAWTLKTLCKCDRILSESEITEFGKAKKFYKKTNDVIPIDHCHLDSETEYLKLRHSLNLPADRHSLTKIELNLPTCLKYGLRSGLTHMHMPKFSSMTRGYQGPAIAVSAIATSVLVEPHCWNEPVIDQVIEDGDTYYARSYKKLKMDDRKFVTLLDMKRDLIVRKTHRITVKIDDPIYAGTFKSKCPKDLHIAKALDLFFKKNDTCVLTSPVLNIAIWKSARYFHIFDGNARLDNCDVASADKSGTAKLMLVQNLTGVLFIILEKSNVQNEPFVLYKVSVVNVQKISELDDDEKSLAAPKRRPSGYLVPKKFRAVVLGNYHLHHPILPQEFQGKGHLVIAVATLVYSKLVTSNKWTKVIIDLIFNQANIYLTDLVRALGKTLDDSFDITVNDLLCDVMFGVYTAKIKVQENAIPGEDKKAKSTLDTGIRQFFTTHSAGLLEMKNTFYAIWKEKNKFYLLDPFACDDEGFRVDPSDPDQQERYKRAAACVTMNSSVNELIEIILENTESKDKDPFVIHGLNVLYVKTGTAKDGIDEKVVFREKQINRRPLRPLSPPSTIADECATVIDTLPRPRRKTDFNVVAQYPEMMDQVGLFVETVDECTSTDSQEASGNDQLAAGYTVVNPNRLMLKGSKNCMSRKFREESRGKQGLVIALAAIAQAERIDVAEWSKLEVDNVVYDGCEAYEDLLSWIQRGSPENEFDSTEAKDENHGNGKDQRADRNFETSSRNSESKLLQALDHLDLSMIPKRFRIGGSLISVESKINIAEGEANPLANLGEALERYFKHFDDAIFENKKLVYGIFKRNDKFFIFNPYGSNREGWRNNIGSATLTVVDSVNELVNVIYGLLEFNDYIFILHLIKVKLADENGIDDDSGSSFSGITKFEKYKTVFLPVTDENLAEMEASQEENEVSKAESRSEERNSTVNDGEESMETISTETSSVGVKESVDLFESADEPEQSDAPSCLNFALITGIVKIEDINETQECKENLQIFYEKLKYKHAPPFVMPPRKNVCHLLEAKKASESMHSLLSRFSIDSRLVVEEKVDASSEDENIKINSLNDSEQTKLITLPCKKYFFSFSLPDGLTPIRAVDDEFIRDKQAEEERERACRSTKAKNSNVMIAECSSNVETSKILPVIVPLGPCIMTPEPKRETHDCPDKKQRKKCKLSEMEQEDIILRKLVCSTEDLILQMILPDLKQNDETEKPESIKSCEPVCGDLADESEESIAEAEPCGFKQTDDEEEVGIIMASMSLEDRATVESKYYKSCYFSAILCILAKINVSVHEFRSSFLDRFILTAKKISSGTGKLSYKMTRWFRNFDILGAKYNVIVKQVRYADPENYEPDALKLQLRAFLQKHSTGIVTFGNASCAFWFADGAFYLFDPYACDENGRASAEGSGCLLEFCTYDKFVERIVENNGQSTGESYRLYSIAISHLESEKKRKCKKRRKARKSCEEPEPEDNMQADEEECDDLGEEQTSETSLIELSEWLDKSKIPSPDLAIPGFQPVKNYNASALEVSILENEITRPNLAPLRDEAAKEPIRETPYDRKFYENSILAEPMDLCMMAWSQIHDPTSWSVRTVQALYRACTEYALDSLLASEDSSVTKMTDDLLTEFGIANYTFRAVLAPMHTGILYADVGWNLAMSLEKILESPVHTGAILVCNDIHIGLMKKDKRYYAWWLVKHTKNIRIIVSEDMADFLRLIVKEINQPRETEFMMRIVTISYAKMYGPNCSDIEGLHEPVMPSSSIAEIHTKQTDDYDMESIFKQIDRSRTPIVVFGSVALVERDAVVEPRVKRCYFAALFAVIMKRDVVQNPLPGMIDKILELADNTYKLFEEPEYHTEHILKDVGFMDRTFDIRDCASELVSLLDENRNIDKSLFTAAVTKQIKQLLKKSDGGIIHFSNCCYGFWYSKATNCYYYLDPYQCDTKGKVVHMRGKSCLFIFSSICGMVRQMCYNQFEETTGFFIHRIHVESVNSKACDKFQEDPIWNYMDYHWSYAHVPKLKKNQKANSTCKKQLATREIRKPMWKNYLIEVPNLIYSSWGTLGTFDPKFGSRACKNQAAICVAAFAMQNLCHPSEWSATVLDSAVICGDSYYKESKNVSGRCLNSFNLSECLKISPFIWNVEFKKEICGILYSTANSSQPNLANSMEHAFKISTNLLLKCERKIVGMLRTSDAFYAVDSSWTGVPLYSEKRGAIYALRCKNLNALVYAVTKMLNTNKKLEFTLTPVKLVFKQETCQSSDAKPKISRQKILSKPVHVSPGQTLDHSTLVAGSVTTPDEDYYLMYKRNLKIGLSRHMKIKTKSKSSKKGSQTAEFEVELLERNVGYPRVMNLLETLGSAVKTSDSYSQAKGSMDQIIQSRKLISRGRRLDVRRSFVEEEAREIFQRYNLEIERDIYTTYKHTRSRREVEEEVEVGEAALADQSASVTIEIVVDGVDAEKAQEIVEEVTEEIIGENTTSDGDTKTYRSSIHLNIEGN